METAYQKILKEKNRQSIDFRRFITWKGNGNTVYNHVGCDIGFLREWIENMFVEDMNWSNYGSVWVIDHIVPFRMFDIFKEEELRLCWNYRNLMPLLKSDNLKKEGNVFFAMELLYSRKDKDSIYAALFDKILPECRWMVKYIDNYDSKPFK
jgi:hypothetical protein